MSLEYRILKEIWSGKKVKLLHLKVLMCISHMHIDDSEVSKCTFVGYYDEVFGYRLWDDQNEKAI